MRSITPIFLVLAVLLMAGFACASSQQSKSDSMARSEETYRILCLSHNLSNRDYDVTASPVYDWVHAGQQGLSVTLANKTKEDMTVDWTNVRTFGNSGNASLEEKNVGGEKRYEVVPPGVSVTRTLWPRSDILKSGRFQNRTISVTLKTGNGEKRRDGILIDVQQEQRVCSR